MRRVSANYIFSPNLSPIRNGVLEFDDKGYLHNIIDPKGEELASVEWYNGVLVPGFVNAHCHLELSQLKDIIPPHQGMTGFIKGIFANNGKYEFNEQAIKNADEAMYHEGVVAVGDISNHDKSLSIKKNSYIYYHTFFEALGLDPNTAKSIHSRIQQLVEHASTLKLSASASPHAFYSMSQQLWEELKPLFANQIVSFHHLESAEENLFIQERKGELYELMQKISPNGQPTSPPLTMGQLLTQYISDAQNILLIHNGALTEQELSLYNKINASLYFVLCPLSNQYIGNALPDISLLKKFDAQICIGTDSLASNTQLSILEEIKVILNNNPQLAFTEALQWATLNGAKALHVSDRFGSFEIGKKPGAVLLSHFDFEKNTLTDKSSARRII